MSFRGGGFSQQETSGNRRSRRRNNRSSGAARNAGALVAFSAAAVALLVSPETTETESLPEGWRPLKPKELEALQEFADTIAKIPETELFEKLEKSDLPPGFSLLEDVDQKVFGEIEVGKAFMNLRLPFVGNPNLKANTPLVITVTRLNALEEHFKNEEGKLSLGTFVWILGSEGVGKSVALNVLAAKTISEGQRSLVAVDHSKFKAVEFILVEKREGDRPAQYKVRALSYRPLMDEKNLAADTWAGARRLAMKFKEIFPSLKADDNIFLYDHGNGGESLHKPRVATSTYTAATSGIISARTFISSGPNSLDYIKERRPYVIPAWDPSASEFAVTAPLIIPGVRAEVIKETYVGDGPSFSALDRGLQSGVSYEPNMCVSETPAKEALAKALVCADGTLGDLPTNLRSRSSILGSVFAMINKKEKGWETNKDPLHRKLCLELQKHSPHRLLLPSDWYERKDWPIFQGGEDFARQTLCLRAPVTILAAASFQEAKKRTKKIYDGLDLLLSSVSGVCSFAAPLLLADEVVDRLLGKKKAEAKAFKGTWKNEAKTRFLANGNRFGFGKLFGFSALSGFAAAALVHFTIGSFLSDNTSIDDHIDAANFAASKFRELEDARSKQ